MSPAAICPRKTAPALEWLTPQNLKTLNAVEAPRQRLSRQQKIEGLGAVVAAPFSFRLTLAH